MTSQSLRSNVLQTYKKILKVANCWESRNGSVADTLKERNYMKDETKSLFRKYKHLESTDEINKYLQDAEARLAIALHYKTPYPRPVNVPPKTFVKPRTLGQSVIKDDQSL